MKQVYLEEITSALESGARPKGGASEISGEIPSLGGENVNSQGGFEINNVRLIPQSFFNSMNSGKINIDDILIVKDGATTGKVSLVRDDFPFCKSAVNEHVFIIRINNQMAFPKYIFHFLFSPSGQKLIKLDFRGATVGGISRNFISKVKLPLPSLSEQRRIADILDQADALRAKRRAAITQLELLINSIFKTCFHDSLDNPKRIRLGDLVEEFRYGTSEKSCDQGFPTLRIPNVIGNSIDLNDLKTVQVDLTEFKRLQLMTGDLLFVRTNGNPDYVGRCAVFNSESIAKNGFDPNKFIYASYLIRARLKKNGLIPEILQHYLACDDGRHALRSYCKTSAGQYNINTEGLGSIPIPHFSLNLQQLFLNQINAILKLKSSHRASLAELDALFASLQHRAFRGEL